MIVAITRELMVVVINVSLDRVRDIRILDGIRFNSFLEVKFWFDAFKKFIFFVKMLI